MNSYLQSQRKITFIQIKCRTINLLGENVGEYNWGIETEKDILNASEHIRGAEDMVQRLRERTALAGGLSSIPSTTGSLEGSSALFALHGHCIHINIPTHRHTHKHTKNKNNKFQIKQASIRMVVLLQYNLLQFIHSCSCNIQYAE